MTKISILDCTLRDGAYIVNGQFGINTIKGIIENLADGKIDIIEVGWLKNSIHDKDSTYFEYIEDIIPYLPREKSNSLFSVMLDYGRYDMDKISVNNHNSIDAIRLVFPKEKYKEAIESSGIIKQKGYDLYLQAANTLEYSEEELIALAIAANKVNPFSLSIVDTFGVMYNEDLKKIYTILDKYLHKDITIGFHSHNNLQMSFALSVDFINFVKNSGRNIIIDSSLVGMGRGAGNTCTELLVNYMNNRLNANYDYNCIMDTIDVYMKKFISNYSWGYSIPFCIAGQLGSHVNNIAYLQNYHKVKFKDMKLILEMLPRNKRKLYDYDILEECYINYFSKDIDDKTAISQLRQEISNKNILLICPGKNSENEKEIIAEYIETYKPVIIAINAIPKMFKCNYLFFSNKVRYDYAKKSDSKVFDNTQKIITSNIASKSLSGEILLNFNNLTKLGWKYFDNSTMMMLRLLERMNVKSIAIAGFDGFNETGQNSYNDDILQSNLTKNEFIALNKDIQEMFNDFKTKNPNISIKLITQSRYS